MNRIEQALAEAAFAADELRLFLDTHPAEEAPLQAYCAAAEQVRARRRQLCYAVNPLDAGKNGKWDWVCAPFPWEKEE